MKFTAELARRNAPLYYSGLFCLVFAGVCLVLIMLTDRQVLGINAYIKPTKFFLSTAIFVWTMGWLMTHLPQKGKVKWYSWAITIILVFETLYIFFRASRGELSHFNGSSLTAALLFMAMGVGISILTLWTLYIGLLFFGKNVAPLPKAYLWGIRLGIIAFVGFSFEGGLMTAQSQMAHTVGAPDGGPGIPFFNWSTAYGDLRIAHFFGMHALQLFPLLGYFVLKKSTGLLLFIAAYVGFCVFLTVQALNAMPLLG